MVERKPLNAYQIQKNSQATAIILVAVAKMISIDVVTRYAHQWKRFYGKNLDKHAMIAFARKSFPELRTRKITDHEAEAACPALLNL